jgi:hypothetical protein
MSPPLGVSEVPRALPVGLHKDDHVLPKSELPGNLGMLAPSVVGALFIKSYEPAVLWRGIQREVLENDV